MRIAATWIALGLGALACCIALLVACIACIACIPGCAATPSSPFFGDERFLVVGVHPDAEADALSRKLAAEGLREQTRLRGSTFTALGIDDAEGVPSLVRVITGRGIALSLDPIESHPLERGARYELLAPSSPGQFDSDGDGFDEVFIVQHTYDRAEACLLVYRVQSSGFVDPIEDVNVIAALGGTLGARAPFPCAVGSVDSGDAGVL